MSDYGKDAEREIQQILISLHVTGEYNKQQIRLGHVKLLASENSTVRSFAYLLYLKNVDKNKAKDIISRWKVRECRNQSCSSFRLF